MPSPKYTQRLPKYLTQNDIRAFFGVIQDPRDRALFAVIYHYGLRVSEVGLLERDDIDLERGRIVVKRVKGGLWAERPLFSATRALLEVHFSRPGVNGHTALFPGRLDALKKRQIQALFARYRDAACIPRRLTCHSLRHAIATHLLDAGVSLEFVQDHLGHRSIKSTSIYARITDQHRTAIFRELEASPWIVHPGHTAYTG
ncbi:MAG: tyrosine-type recombinase/integrase [Candidatus Eisenbacteria bacterium]|uniref:Tyrosine-type recombinase/integrase n=1 Tax=Eiseniibacteriota bacterium TaxID=2212470 RepID=A0A948RVZ9_UNCEI|nr:tyrosine-type recombinase/integrase [Candidatus Eisenbacteria bacterium]MBU1949926.1 tyrosine-type recombinase/integrase [Candidatus Eisenbacteria bacterium]MBU2689997.1 tyrosine-type recombinase/integrase [Candidatus Eisenbacteria bacterium]